MSYKIFVGSSGHAEDAQAPLKQYQYVKQEGNFDSLPKPIQEAVLSPVDDAARNVDKCWRFRARASKKGEVTGAILHTTRAGKPETCYVFLTPDEKWQGWWFGNAYAGHLDPDTFLTVTFAKNADSITRIP